MKISSSVIEKTKLAELREKISVVSMTSSVDDEGRPLNSWDKTNPKATPWAKVDAFTSEFVAISDMNRYDVMYQILIRYNAVDILVTDHIFWKGLELEVISPPVNVAGRNVWLVLEAREWK